MFSAFHRTSCAAIAVVTLVATVPSAGAQSDERFPLSVPPAPRVHQPVAHQPPDAPSLKITVTPLPGPGIGAPGIRSGSQMVCVRTCDGFFFPVSAGGSTDRAIAEFMCKASCPGAPVKLFTRRAGGEIEDAVGADRSLYRKLAGALSFRNEVSPACSCRRPSGAITTGPVYDDPTLRAGDVIVVRGRALVFKGGAARPYTERDFAPLEQASLPVETRQKLSSLLYFRPAVAASRSRKFTTAVAASQKPETRTGVRVVLPYPVALEPLPSSLSAFVPAN